VSFNDFFLFPWNAILGVALALLLTATVLTVRSHRRISTLPPLPEGQEATLGAQRQIDAIREQVAHALRAALFAVVLIGVGFAATGWQIDAAFDTLEEERVERIGGQSSINAYFCRKIDEVGDGVAALVAVSLQDAPPRASLTQSQREGFDKFQEYLDRQQRPPRCRTIALQLAILTGADPADVQITPLKVERRSPPP